MDRRIRILLVVVIVVALAYPAAAWVLGMSIERQWHEQEQLAAQRVPYIEVVKSDYRRGVYSSTEEVTYSIGGPLPKSVQGQLMVRNTIHHGPLPQLREFAPATVDTEVVLTPDLRKTLALALGTNAGTLTIHTRMKWVGGSTTLVKSNAFHGKGQDGSEIEWRGLDARFDMGSELGTETVDMAAPGLSLKGPAVNVSFANLSVKSDIQLALETLTLGTVHIALDRLEAEQPAKDLKVTLQSVVFDTKSSMNGDYMDSAATLGTGALQVGKFSASRAFYEQHFDHLHGPSTAALTKAMRTNAKLAATNSTPADYSTRFMEAFKTDGVDILVHEPVLSMPRIGFTTPDGELLVSLKMTAPGITRADLDVPSQALGFALVKHLQGILDVRVDTALLDKLLDSSGRGDTITAQMQGLQRQGYIRLDGKALITHLTFLNGQLKVNDLPFPPVPAARH